MIDPADAVSDTDISADRPLAGHSGTGGRLKVEPEDFRVEEIPSYEPCGEGDHLFLWIRKRDVSAELLVETIARTLSLPRDAIGVAGLKDRRAVTLQWVSVPAAVADQVPLLNSDSIQVLKAIRHNNKLKTGHLRGNRFEILIRDVCPDAFEIAENIRRRIEIQGIPNEFGEQRFGADGQTLELGLSLLKGTVSPQSIPYRRRKFLVKLALSAAQSSLFNEVIEQRRQQGTLQTVLPGDVMQVRASGGLFIAEEIVVEQGRADRRETVITGPLFGPKMKSPLQAAFAIEQAVLDSAGISRELFRIHKKYTMGGRRPLLMFPEELSCEQVAEGIRLKFTLPSGCYATVVLRAFMGESADSLRDQPESRPEVGEDSPVRED